MRIHRLGSTVFAAAAIAAALAAASLAQQPAPQPGPAPSQQPPPLASPKPYKPVTIKLPVPMPDPSFVAFRKQIGDIAQKKDRAALAKLVAQNFFLIAGEKDAADRKKPGIDNLAKALSLDGKDGVEVHEAAKPDAPVIDKLGLYLVRVYPDDSPAAAVIGTDFIRVVLPSGKLGFVAGEQLLSLGNEQLCYAKEGNAWKIAGFIGAQ